jgi:AhpD family alkylhydroperoxidase
MARIEIPPGDGPEVLRALSLRPQFESAVNALEKAVARSGLDWRLHELVRMRVAEINHCTVCLAWRNQSAFDAGVTEELLARVSAADTAAGFSERERVAIEYATRFSTDAAGIDDAFMARLASCFDSGEIVDLTLVIGKYVAMGRFMQVLGLDQSCALHFDDAGVLRTG